MHFLHFCILLCTFYILLMHPSACILLMYIFAFFFVNSAICAFIVVANQKQQIKLTTINVWKMIYKIMIHSIKKITMPHYWVFVVYKVTAQYNIYEHKMYIIDSPTLIAFPYFFYLFVNFKIIRSETK